MKIRSGFVSNSSTASFVIVGTKMTTKQLCTLFNIKDVDEDGGDELFQKLDKLKLELHDGCEVVGETIAVVYDDGDDMEDVDLSFPKLQKIAERVAKKLHVDISEIHLHTGTFAC